MSLRSEHNDLIDLAGNAFLDEKATVCDSCNRYPNYGGDGIRLCSRCELGEFLHSGDLGSMHGALLNAGLASE